MIRLWKVHQRDHKFFQRHVDQHRIAFLNRGAPRHEVQDPICYAAQGAAWTPGATTVTEETDFEGNPTRTVYPSGKEVLYTVDNANRVTSIKLKNGITTSNLLTAMTYVPMGPLKSALYGDGYTQTRTYDKSYRMTGLKDVKGTVKLRELTYLYESRDKGRAASQV